MTHAEPRRRRSPVAGLRLRASALLEDDRGDSSIEMAILLPIVILVTMMVVQGAMWYYAREVALTAAREGVSAGRVYDSSPGVGVQRAYTVLNRYAPSSFSDAPGVSSAGSTAKQLVITVHGRAASIIPGLPGLTITQSASSPREIWTVP